MFKKFCFVFYLILIQFNFIAYAVENIKISGEIEIIVEDNLPEGLSFTKYYLNVDKGKYTKQQIELIFDTNKADKLNSGDKVEILGFFVDNHFFQARNFISIKKIESKQGSVLGTRKAVFFRVNINDANSTYSTEQIIEKMQMNHDWMQNASYNQINFPLDVNNDGTPDVFTVNVDHNKSEGCNAGVIKNKTLAAAASLGVDLSLYQHFAYMLPELNCGWSGLGTVGCGNGCSIWVATPDWNLVYPHEFGHNLGMHHAATDLDEDNTLESEYGDGTCPMGNILSQGYFNAPHSWQLGVLTVDSGNAKTVSLDGKYDLYAPGIGFDQGLPKLLRVSHNNEFYYLSYRPSDNFDLVKGKYNSGVSIYSFSGGSTKTRYHASLDDKQTWIGSGMRVDQISGDEYSVELNIRTQCFQPLRMNVAPGLVAVYPLNPAELSIQLNNPNEVTCPPVDLDLSANLPAGFAAEFTANSFQVAGGESKLTTVKLFTTLRSGQFDVEIKGIATNADEEVSASAHVVVQDTPISILPGLNLAHFNGSWSALPNFSLLTPDEEKIVDLVSVGNYAGKENFGLVFTGLLQISDPGNYKLSIGSDDGSKFFLQNQLFVNNDGLHGNVKLGKSIFLLPGLYPFRIEFFERSGGEVIDFFWQKDAGEETKVPASALFYLEKVNSAPFVDAGANMTRPLGKPVTLLGQAKDEDGYIAELGWRLLKSPENAFPVSSKYHSVVSKYKFTPTVLGKYVFEFFATDNSGATSVDSVQVAIK